MRKPPFSSSSTSCSGIGSVAPPRRRSSSDALLPDLLEQHQALLGGAGVDLLLHLLVVVAPDAAHHGPVDLHRGALAVGGERDVPDEGRTHLVGQQARGALAQLGRVQLDALVGAVDRLATAAGLGVDGTSGADEGRHVGDGVAHPVAVAVALDRHGLVEVHRGRRVDGDERDRPSRPAPAGGGPGGRGSASATTSGGNSSGTSNSRRTASKRAVELLCHVAGLRRRAEDDVSLGHGATLRIASAEGPGGRRDAVRASRGRMRHRCPVCLG